MTLNLPDPVSTIYLGRYKKLLSYAQTLSFDEYTERHHILPRSMAGSDDIDNLIDLPGRLHFLAHWLLWKTYKNRQMTRAFFMMRNVKSGGQSRYQKIGSRTYAKLREEYSKNNPMRDPEIVAKISGDNSPSKTAKSRAARTGVNHFSARPDYICKTSGENHHMKRADIVANISGENHFTKQDGYVNKRKGKPQPQMTCPHCGKSGGNSNMARWHFDNCKSLLNYEAKE